MSIKQAWDWLPSFWKAIVIGVPVASGIFTLIINFSPTVNAWDASGFPTMATRAWVRENTVPLQETLRGLRVDSINGKLEASISARNKLELDALKYDEEGKLKAQQEMRRLDEGIDDLRKQKQAITGTRGPQ